MTVYHGTVVKGLTTLRPFASPHSNLDYPCVYLSTDKALASIYIWKHPFKWMTFEIGADGVPVYNESFKDSLRIFYSGVEGVIYTCSGEFGRDQNTGIRHAVVSRDPVRVDTADEVPDAYKRILRYEAEGRLRIRRYEELTEGERRRVRNMVRGAIRRLDLLRGEHPLSGFVSATFPEWWEEERRKTANGTETS